ncbi:hypothetical protein [uncultured Sulfitobacter sp.]|uniref:hypothetical protein n=1 Tax=uncultured Sulfitobacter sp. TaxID=191468 RepID=UPI00260B1589|nr:hypothetical protein [uncultured Sulfitobacter sp.]
MNTWTSKPLAALGIIVMLGACEGVDAGKGLLANLTPPEDAALPAVPLTQALMMRGNVTLVPPNGYCIDPESLTQSFAMMARCDALGAATGGIGAPVGVLTVSLARNAKDATLPSAAEVASAAGLGTPEDIRPADGSIVFKTSGATPGPDLAPKHWRSVAQIDRYTMGAALFGPEGRRAVSLEGAGVLEQLIKRTTDKTAEG